MMLKALLKVRLAAFGAYFTGASRSRRRQSKVQASAGSISRCMQSWRLR